MSDVPKLPPKVLETMKSVAVGHNKPIIMEVIGEQGQKVAEYVDKKDKPLPYQIIHERIQNVI